MFEFKGVLMNKKEKSKIIFLSGIITLLIILCIYALNGEIINQGKLMGGENIISVLKGIYIVKVKNYIKKVIVL